MQEIHGQLLSLETLNHEGHLLFMRRITSEQNDTVCKIKELLDAHVKEEFDVSYPLLEFGSRAYGNPLPSSDLDIVCTLPLQCVFTKVVSSGLCSDD